MGTWPRARTVQRRYWRDTSIAERLQEKERAEEDVFFRRRDRELLRQISTATGQRQRAYVRELTRMRCPECGRPLVNVRHLGVSIDECPEQHGMWLTDDERHTLAERERHSWLSRYLYAPRSGRRFPALTSH